MFRILTTLIAILIALSGQVEAQFETRSTIPSLRLPYSVAVGDLNHDGKADVVVASDQVAVLMGKATVRSSLQ